MSTTSVPTTNPVVSHGIPIALALRGPIDTGLPADRPDTPGLIDRFGRVATFGELAARIEAITADDVLAAAEALRSEACSSLVLC